LSSVSHDLSEIVCVCVIVVYCVVDVIELVFYVHLNMLSQPLFFFDTFHQNCIIRSPLDIISIT